MVEGRQRSLAAVCVLLLILFALWWRREGDRTWHLAESAPIDVPPSALPDDGSWDQWRVAASAFVAAGGDSASRRPELLQVALAAEGAPNPETLSALMSVFAALDALPDPQETRGFRIPAGLGDPPTTQEVPVGLQIAFRAWTTRAWSRLPPDPVGAMADLRAAHRLGVLLEHSGSNLFAVVLGSTSQRTVLREATEMVRSGVLGGVARSLVDDAHAAAALGSGLPAGIAGDCNRQEARFEALSGLDLQAPRWLPGPASQGGASSTKVGFPPLYSAKRTIAAHRHACRLEIAYAVGAAGGAPPPEFDQPQPAGLAAAVDNGLGRILLGVAVGIHVPIVERHRQLGTLREELAQALREAER